MTFDPSAAGLLHLLPVFGIWYIVFLFSTVAHEAAHGWVAHLGGDSTAYSGGQVTLDPLVHIRRTPWGMVLIPILSFFQTGWMMGWASVPFDAEWGKRRGEFLPSESDRDFIESLMKPETEPAKFASWIAPPKVGIDNKPGEFEYVKIA